MWSHDDWMFSRRTGFCKVTGLIYRDLGGRVVLAEHFGASSEFIHFGVCVCPLLIEEMIELQYLNLLISLSHCERNEHGAYST